MNHTKKITLALLTVSLAAILSVSYVHAQTLSLDGSPNSTSQSNSTLDSVGFTNSTAVNPTLTTNSTISAEHYTCAHTLSSQMKTIYDLLDGIHAKSLAINDNNFLSAKQGFNYTFDSMYTEWSFDAVKCDKLTLKDIGVVYSLYDTSGRSIKSLTVTEDPLMSKVVNVTESEPIFASSLNAPNWSGYEMSAQTFLYPFILPITPVYEAEAQFNVQSVSRPTDPANACTGVSSSVCDSLIWSGLTDTFGAHASGHLVQGGAQATISGCNPTCSTTYHVWYENLPNPLHQCLNVIVAPNHNIVSDIYNDVIYGGSTTTYSMNIVVFNQPGQACATVITNYPMDSPVFGEFIVERTGDSITIDNSKELPKYDFNPSINGLMYYNGSLNSIYGSYTHGEYNLITMANPWKDPPIVNNMVPGSINSAGTFTDTWVSSKNTCDPPGSGLDWIISSNCTPGYTVTATGNNVILQSNSVLTITPSSKLLMDFANKYLLIQPGSGVLIQPGGAISKN